MIQNQTFCLFKHFNTQRLPFKWRLFFIKFNEVLFFLWINFLTFYKILILNKIEWAQSWSEIKKLCLSRMPLILKLNLGTINALLMISYKKVDQRVRFNSKSNRNSAFHEPVKVAHLSSIFFQEIFNLIRTFLNFHLKGRSWNMLVHILLLKFYVHVKLDILIYHLNLLIINLSISIKLIERL